MPDSSTTTYIAAGAAAASVLFVAWLRRNAFMGNTLDGYVYRLEHDDEELVEFKCAEEGIGPIGDDGATRIALALVTNNTKCVHLDLSGMKIGDDGAEKLAMALLLNKTVTLIRLHKNNITDKGAEKLQAAMRHNHTVTTLFVSMSNPIKDGRINEEIQRLVKINADHADSPDDAAKEKQKLFGVKWTSEGTKLRKQAEETMSELAKARAESSEQSVNTMEQGSGHKKSD